MSLRKCLMCGVGTIDDAGLCPQCEWPYITNGWRRSSIAINRLTFDTGCVNAKKRNIYLNKLEEWENKGLLLIQKATPFLAELKGQERIEKAKKIVNHPGLFTIGNSILGGQDVLAGPDLINKIQQVLFPSVNELNQNQLNDVLHVREHVKTGGHLFVTLNTRDFIDSSKQDKLQFLGIWVFTPEEAVQLLSELYSWN